MNYLEAHLILDRSGSMETHRDTTIEAINGYVANLKADQSTQADLWLTTFDTESIDLVWNERHAYDVPPLNRETYVPRSGTPLFDAIGGVIGVMRTRKRPANVKVALVIITDGEENSSKEYTLSAVKALLEGVQKDGWAVIYLGANQDAFKVGAALGMHSGHTMNYSGEKMHFAMNAASRATMSHAAGSVQDSYFTDDERAAAVGKAKAMPLEGSALKK